MSDPTIEIVRIDGINQLYKLTDPLRARTIIARTLMRIGLIVERNSKKNTPVRTGNLKRSITTVRLGDDLVAVGTKVEYARFVHEGTRRMRGRPYLRRGLEQSRELINREIDNALEKVVNP